MFVTLLGSLNCSLEKGFSSWTSVNFRLQRRSKRRKSGAVGRLEPPETACMSWVLRLMPPGALSIQYSLSVSSADEVYVGVLGTPHVQNER